MAPARLIECSRRRLSSPPLAPLSCITSPLAPPPPPSLRPLLGTVGKPRRLPLRPARRLNGRPSAANVSPSRCCSAAAAWTAEGTALWAAVVLACGPVAPATCTHARTHASAPRGARFHTDPRTTALLAEGRRAEGGRRPHLQALRLLRLVLLFRILGRLLRRGRRAHVGGQDAPREKQQPVLLADLLERGHLPVHQSDGQPQPSNPVQPLRTAAGRRRGCGRRVTQHTRKQRRCEKGAGGSLRRWCQVRAHGILRAPR